MAAATRQYWLLCSDLVAGGGWFAYSWTQKQYYVGTDGDYVAIFKGVDEQIPGLNLSNIYEEQTTAGGQAADVQPGAGRGHRSRPTT